MEQRRFTGWHAFAMLFAFFGVVVAVNVVMAREAFATFGGLVVENSYVASQDFNRWLNEAKVEDNLGWQAAATRQPDGRVVVAVGQAPAGVSVKAMARHPLGRLPDREVTFDPIGANRFLSREPLPAGRWQLRLTLAAEGKTWRHEEYLQ